MWWYWNWETKNLPKQKPYFNKNIDINKFVLFNKVLGGGNGVLNILLVGNMVKNIIPLCVLTARISVFRRNFDETKYMSFW